MSVTFEFAANGTDLDITQTYYAYLRRDVDGLYWDPDDSTYKAFGDLVGPSIRAVEDVACPGLWSITFPLDIGDTGTYTFLPRNGITLDLLVNDVTQVYLVDGSRTQDTLRAKVALSHHYGTYDTLQLLDELGEPVEGADVRVYTKFAYDAGEYDVPVGVTQTNHLGRWVAPVHVPSATTYVVHFHLDSVIGPTIVEIIVP